MTGVYCVTNGGVYNDSSNVREQETTLSIPTLTAPSNPQEEVLQMITGEVPRERTNTIWDTDDDSDKISDSSIKA